MDVYGGREPGAIGLYTVIEAARYLQIPPSTLRDWVRGRTYPVSEGETFATPLIALPSGDDGLMSFENLVEAHVLAALRRKHRVRFAAVRRAVEFVGERLGVARPLIDVGFITDGSALFVEHYGQLVDVSACGQLALGSMLAAHLQRVERDARGLARRLYPFTRASREPADPKVIVIDPRIAFGQPVVAGTGVQTAIIAERYLAGESIEALATDYRCERIPVEEALRVELLRAA